MSIKRILGVLALILLSAPVLPGLPATLTRISGISPDSIIEFPQF